jgi:hypothetical protein
MSINYHFAVATRLGEDQAQLTPEHFTIDSTSLQELISIYHAAIGEERPYIGWMEDAIDLSSADEDEIVEADDCTDPEACLATLAVLREGMVTHAALLPPFTWITPLRADGKRGFASTSARVQFEGAEWSVWGGFDATKAHEVISPVIGKGKSKGKKSRSIDLRGVATWECQDQAGQPLVLEFDRRPFGTFVERILTGITNICESARTQGALVAIGSVP